MTHRQPSEPIPDPPNSSPCPADHARPATPRAAARHSAGHARRRAADSLAAFHAELAADTAPRLAAMPPAYTAAFRAAIARRELYADLPAQRAAAAEACRAVFSARRHRLAAVVTGEGLPPAAGLAAAAAALEGRRDGLTTLAGHMHAHAGRAEQWKVFGAMLEEGW